MGLKRLFTSNLVHFLPPTRFYRLKAILYQFAGLDVHGTARIVSMDVFGDFYFSIGEDTYVGKDVLVTGGKCSIKIGSYCDIGHRVCIYGGTHEVNMNRGHTAGPGYSRDVTIEDGAWVGSNVVILGGVTIGEKAIVSAGTVVRKNVLPYTMVSTNGISRSIRLPSRGTFKLG